MTYPALAGFLSGYLHQDWDLEADDPLDLVREFAATERVEVVTKVTEELEALLATGAGETDLAAEVGAMGCAVDPAGAGMTMRAWLAQVQRILLATAERRTGGAST